MQMQIQNTFQYAYDTLYNHNYFQIVTCWDKTFMISREKNDKWETRFWTTYVWSFPRIKLLHKLPTLFSHNMAVFCINYSTLLAVGGSTEQEIHFRDGKVLSGMVYVINLVTIGKNYYHQMIHIL